jgi:imidazoleglycerol-phosphate dehydratase
MLDLVARHGAFDLTIAAQGDLDVDQHHTVEDV